MDCCGWVVNQDGVLYRNLLEPALCKRGPGCEHLEEESDGHRALIEAGWATSHG